MSALVKQGEPSKKDLANLIGYLDVLIQIDLASRKIKPSVNKPTEVIQLNTSNNKE